LATQKPNPVPLLDIALVFIATFFVFLFGSAASLLSVGEEPTLVIGELLLLAVPLGYLLLKRIDIISYVKIDLKPRYILIGLACGALLLLLNITVSNILTAIFGVSQAVQDSNSLLTSLSTSPRGFVAVVASLALAGVCEEFFFRGFLQNSIFRTLKTSNTPRYAFAVAVGISALIFGLFHFDTQFVYTLAAFITGLALGYIYHRWNYTVSATAHASMNLIVLALLLLGL
jgi:membrane protease YdiL (CAAX protease family)